MKWGFQLNEQRRMTANKNILVMNVNLLMMCFFTTEASEVLRNKSSFFEVTCDSELKRK